MLSASHRSSWFQTGPHRFPGKFSGTGKTENHDLKGSKLPLCCVLSGAGVCLYFGLGKIIHVSALHSVLPLFGLFHYRAGVAELARELEFEVESEDVTELLQFHDKTLMDEELLLMD